MDQDSTNQDRMLEATLNTRLEHAPGLGAVRAAVSGGVATVTGEVGEAVDVKRVLLIAQAVDGLREVHEELTVTGVPLDEQEAYIHPVEESSNYPANREAVGDLSLLGQGSDSSSAVKGDSLAALIRDGMEAFDSEGNSLGRVKEARASDFLLARPLASDLYVPYIACVLQPDGVHLNVRGSELKDQGWAVPGE